MEVSISPTKQPDSFHAFREWLLTRGLSQYCENTFGSIVAWENELIVVPDTKTRGSFISDAWSQFIEYPIQELALLRLGRPIEFLLSETLRKFAFLFRLASFAKVAWIANHLSTTNRISELVLDKIALHRHHWAKILPSRAILVRGLSLEQAERLKNYGFEYFATRQVYIFDSSARKKETYKRDLKLLKDPRFRLIRHKEFEWADLREALRLYKSLYVEKHSPLNPIYTEEFFLAAQEKNFFEFYGYRDEAGHLVAVGVLLEQEGELFVPIMGYDVNREESQNHYRRLAMWAFEAAHERGLRLNFSSGAGEFKRRRGGQAQIEYTAYYCEHLPFFRRLPWRIYSRTLGPLAEISYRKLGI